MKFLDVGSYTRSKKKPLHGHSDPVEASEFFKQFSVFTAELI